MRGQGHIQIPMPIQAAVPQTLDYLMQIHILLKRLQSGTCGFIRPNDQGRTQMQFANPNPRLAQRPKADSGSSYSTAKWQVS